VELNIPLINAIKQIPSMPNSWRSFDGYSGYNHIVINLEDQEKKLHLHVHLVHMHIKECLLVSIMHLQLFKDAWWVFFLTMLK
jgi:hypothetical protein